MGCESALINPVKASDEMVAFMTKIPEEKWMPQARCHSSMVVIKNKMYLFGGHSSEAKNDVSVLKPISWEWSRQEYKSGLLDFVPNPRYGHSASAKPGSTLMYVFGGYKKYNKTFGS